VRKKTKLRLHLVRGRGRLIYDYACHTNRTTTSVTTTKKAGVFTIYERAIVLNKPVANTSRFNCLEKNKKNRFKGLILFLLS